MEQVLSYQEVLSLYASADVLVSLHRSEGLGLHLMEAMSLGKVVVATDWSGNADFMSPEATVGVPYRLVPVRTGHGAYRPEMGRPGQVWADADVEAAARALRWLHEQPERRRAMGTAAARLMDERRALVRAGGAFAELEARLARGVRPDVPFGWALWVTRRSLLWIGIRNEVGRRVELLRGAAGKGG